MKKSLREIVIANNKAGKYLTDKAGGEFAVQNGFYFEKCHEYADLYDFLFNHIRDKAINLLEVGIARGGSIQAWLDYFENGNIYGIDIYPFLPNNGINFNHPRVKTFYEDAYSERMLEKLKNIKFDIIVDDGPHTLESQKQFIKMYSGLVNSGGYIVVEDISTIQDARELHKLLLPITSFSMIVDRNEVSKYGGNEINLIGVIK